MPRDPGGTMDRVERTHILRFGIVDTARLDEPSGKTLGRILERTGSHPQIVVGDSEDLLSRLEEGELDLVFGEFPKSSPWNKAVHLGAAQGHLGKVPKSKAVPRFAAMNGENGWIMLIAEASK